MDGSWFKDLRNQALLYLAGGILSSALGLLAWVILYKLHVYFDFPKPNIDGAVAIAFGGMIIFKYLTEIKLELLGFSIEDILPSLVTKILFGLLFLVIWLDLVLVLGKIAKRLNAVACKSAPSGSGVRIPLFPLLSI